MTLLFKPLRIGRLELSNRIIIAPMCQYSADENGSPTQWHHVHLGSLAVSGAGMLILESTAVSERGRITQRDLGLYSDTNEAELLRLVGNLRSISSIPLALQIGHAGRKASSAVPWEGGAQIRPGSTNGWKSEAPSGLPHADGEIAPEELTEEGLLSIKNSFVTTALRACRVGFDGIEVHLAHGYLLHQFLSPLSNRRADKYGGSLENRMRFPLEVFRAVRDAVPSDVPVWARLSAHDWVDGGWTIDDAVVLGTELKAIGCDALHVSSGGISAAQAIKLGPGYQVPFARRLKQEVGMPTIAVGLITTPTQAESILRSGDADAVALARGILYNPRWVWHAAAELGAAVEAPPQYWRAAPREAKDIFSNANFGQR